MVVYEARAHGHPLSGGPRMLDQHRTFGSEVPLVGPSSAEALDVRDTDPVLHVKLLEVLHLPEDHPRPISERGSHAGPLSRLRRRVTADTPPRWRKPFRMSARGAIKGLTQTRNADYNSHDRRSIHIRYCFRLERRRQPLARPEQRPVLQEVFAGIQARLCERGITGGWMADSACSTREAGI